MVYFAVLNCDTSKQWFDTCLPRSKHKNNDEEVRVCVELLGMWG